MESAKIDPGFDLLTKKQVAAILLRTVRSVDTLIKNESIEHIKVRGRVLFRRSAVHAYLNGHTVPVFVQPVKKSPNVLDMKMGRF